MNTKVLFLACHSHYSCGFLILLLWYAPCDYSNTQWWQEKHYFIACTQLSRWKHFILKDPEILKIFVPNIATISSIWKEAFKLIQRPSQNILLALRLCSYCCTLHPVLAVGKWPLLCPCSPARWGAVSSGAWSGCPYCTARKPPGASRPRCGGRDSPPATAARCCNKQHTLHQSHAPRQTGQPSTSLRKLWKHSIS